MTLIKLWSLCDYGINPRNIAVLGFCRQGSGVKGELCGLIVQGRVGCLQGIPLNAACTEELCINISIVKEHSKPQ